MAEWSNWAGDQVCRPRRLVRPTSRDDLAVAVAGARDDGVPAKVVGSGHSFTSAAMTDGVMIDVGHLDRILDVDHDTGQVTVEAGIVLADLNDALASQGLALPNLGDIDRQTLAGAISTATHGTGAELQNISAQVVACDLVTGTGEVVTINGGDDLRAARVGIGALGALATVTLQCVPAFRLHRSDHPRPLAELFDGFDDLAADNDHFEFFVFPRMDTGLQILRNRTDEAPRPRSRASVAIDEAIDTYAGNALLGLTRLVPATIPAFSRLATRLLGEGDYVDASHRVFASTRSVRFTEMEYAVPRADGVAVIREVLQIVARHDVAMPIEVRVVGADDALLSPTHQRDSTYVAVHQYRGMPWQPFFTDVEAVMAQVAGRPHWGKRHQLDAETVRQRYPRFEDFLAVRDRLDPDRTFANAYTRRVLGP